VTKLAFYSRIRSVQQGYSSTTYFVTFVDNSSIVVQFRPASRPLDAARISSVRLRLGCLVPEAQLLQKIQNDTIFVYQMTRIPGNSFSSFLRTPDFVHFLPSIAAGMGHLLGKCYIPGSRTIDNQAWFEMAQEQMQAAADSDDPLLVVNQTHYRKMLDILRSGALNDLPLAITNDDISPTNIIVNNGILTGLVDWEHIEERPLGWELRAVFWMMGKGMGGGENYALHNNSLQIQDAFWKEFGAQLHVTVRQQRSAIQSAMQISAAASTCLYGKYNGAHVASLPSMLEYSIPPAFWSSEL
jgi:Phosphotransferase enzyme family